MFEINKEKIFVISDNVYASSEVPHLWKHKTSIADLIC